MTKNFDDLADQIIATKDDLTQITCPLFIEQIKAGFPSPAEGYLDEGLDLNELMIKNPPSTFYLRVNGESMVDAGINSGDLLVVDRSIKPVNGKIIIAALNDELTVKRLKMPTEKGPITLMPENSKFSPIEVTKGMEFEIWGVVTGVVRQL